MNSLRIRLTALTALVALVCTTLCAYAASRALGVPESSVDALDAARERMHAQQAIYLVGMASAIGAGLIGVALAWLWLRPLRVLVEACRARTADPALPLPPLDGPEEVSVLRDALQTLLDGEQAARAKLAQALEREITINAVHQRFLAQLGHEFARPIRALTATIELLHAQGGRVEPERLEEAHHTALALEERFQEVIGLASDHLDLQAPSPVIAADRYLADLANLLRPQAARSGVAIVVDAPATSIPLDARLLSPILVNLAANAIAACAGRGRGTVSLRARIADGSRWTVQDDGPGIAADLAARIADACAAGETLPAEPGLGLGLALALANTRALGGRLSLIGNSPEGAAFELVLPPASPLPSALAHRPSRS